MPPQAVFDGVEVKSVRRKVIKMCRTRQDAFIDEFAFVAPEAISDQRDGRVRRPRKSADVPEPARPEMSQLRKNSLRIFSRSGVNVVSKA